MNEFVEENESICEEAVIRGMTPLQVFFERYSEISTERGDGPDFDACFLRGQTSRGGTFRLDGWALESFDTERGKRGVNAYAIGCYFDTSPNEPRVVGAQEFDKHINEIRRGVQYVMQESFLVNSEVTDESILEFGFQLREAKQEITGIKLLVFRTMFLKHSERLCLC